MRIFAVGAITTKKGASGIISSKIAKAETAPPN